MDTLYLLLYFEDSGASEDGLAWYTPCEVFSSEEDREKRIEFLKTVKNEDDEPYEYIFHKRDVKLMTPELMQIHPDSDDYKGKIMVTPLGLR